MPKKRVIELFCSPQGQRETNEQSDPKESKESHRGGVEQNKMLQVPWNGYNGLMCFGTDDVPRDFIWNGEDRSSEEEDKKGMCFHPKSKHLWQWRELLMMLEMLLQAHTQMPISDLCLWYQCLWLEIHVSTALERNQYVGIEYFSIF